MANETLFNDIVDAVVAAMREDVEYWSPPLGLHVVDDDEVLNVENSRPGAERMTRGVVGVASVSLTFFEVERSFEKSVLARVGVEILCDCIEVQDGVRSSALLARAAIHTFESENIAQHLSQTTDSWRGGGIETRIESTEVREATPGRLVIAIPLSLRLWLARSQEPVVV